MTETPIPAVHFATSLQPPSQPVAGGLQVGDPRRHRGQPGDRPADAVLGAWPVLGFMGLDIWLLWWLFKRSYLDARRSETLVLTDSELLVDRVAPDGEREEHRLDAYWLRLDVTEERLVVISAATAW